MNTIEFKFGSGEIMRVCFNFVIAWIVLTLLLACLIGTEILRTSLEGICSQTRGQAGA